MKERRHKGRRGLINKDLKLSLSSRSIEISDILAECKMQILCVALFSSVVNVLMLVGAFYMLEVYDRVLPSRSIPTLVVLSILALFLFVVQGLFDFVRSRILVRIASHLEERLCERIYDLLSIVPQINRVRPEHQHAQRHLDSIKAFLSSGGPGAMLDLPWIPFFIFIMFMFHWALGVAALFGSAVLIGLTIFAQYRTSKPGIQLGEKLAARGSLTLAIRRNAEVISSMSMHQPFAERYRQQAISVDEAQTQLSDAGGGLGAISRVLRLIMQSAILGLGALLVIWGDSSPGVIIAGSVLFGRALAPVDQVIANWRGFASAQDGWTKLSHLFKTFPSSPEKLQLPRPRSSVQVEALSFLEAGSQKVLVRDISFSANAGDGVCVIGPSAAGKSTLVRLLVNAWQPTVGRVMLDGASLDQWPPYELGRHIGYLPQDVDLFAGSIAENIGRFYSDLTAEAVIEAAKAAGVHDLVLKMKDGYQTQVGDNGASLSSGQRQRIALARALYGNPFLVVLDEPNSNLDGEGDAALSQAVHQVRTRGGIVIGVSHRPGLLDAFDTILLLRDSRQVAFGPKAEILAKYLVKPQTPVHARDQHEVQLSRGQRLKEPSQC